MVKKFEPTKFTSVDFSALETALVNSRVATENNALYQVIRGLIDKDKQFEGDTGKALDTLASQVASLIIIINNIKGSAASSINQPILDGFEQLDEYYLFNDNGKTCCNTNSSNNSQPNQPIIIDNYEQIDDYYLMSDFGGGLSMPDFLAYINRDNLFSANQTITKVRPALNVLPTGGTAAGHVFSTGNIDAHLTTNVTFDGTNYNLDDISQPGDMLLLNNIFIFYHLTAGANPRTATEVFKITAAGLVQLLSGQIEFPSTPNPSANKYTFDDYHEDTWTPADGSGAALSITVTSADYTKKGREVGISFEVVYPATASGAGAVLSGLPFTSLRSAGLAVGFCNSGVTMTAYIPAGTQTVQFYNNGGGQITNAQLTGKTVQCSGIFFV